MSGSNFMDGGGKDPQCYNKIKKPSAYRVKTGAVGYNNKILVSDGKFILGKKGNVNSLKTPAIKSHKDSNIVKQTAVTHKDLERKPTITHEEEKIALILTLTGIFTIWYLSQ